MLSWHPQYLVDNCVKKIYLEECQTRLENGTWKGRPMDEEESRNEMADEWLNGLRAKERFATGILT
ncbi:Oxidoreductase FAD/NAD(P)-binding [Penicillium crustosum]|uniref:Oxidoreductase FAD/NAD(P)-binding n=1 Tax=Penicillium crustosum TaxID=36656 RepID=UPI00239055C6|nr:Oxidoreductase FAD/NAD(P)-binding [Penicillium crustosum]KAJ5417391.1 Oxidoreductase FAD/NAD(P)-binding [Penicillium crustosum]